MPEHPNAKLPVRGVGQPGHKLDSAKFEPDDDFIETYLAERHDDDADGPDEPDNPEDPD